MPLDANVLERSVGEILVYRGPASDREGDESVRLFVSASPTCNGEWRYRAVFVDANGDPVDERIADQTRTATLTIKRFGKPDFVFRATRLKGRALVNAPLPFSKKEIPMS